MYDLSIINPHVKKSREDVLFLGISVNNIIGSAVLKIPFHNKYHFIVSRHLREYLDKNYYIYKPANVNDEEVYFLPDFVLQTLSVFDEDIKKEL